ncbi:hypothetical protein Baya_12516 [Bagarius yarrelli]|uniref:Uncharacterized protein n=1 Tax=Bagarius yarrelli TaxID=175774 RepID=A0A556V3F7_BAGYA|nr:hypothetical protein Baya_12516 [Bagarius yarrelli]
MQARLSAIRKDFDDKGQRTGFNLPDSIRPYLPFLQRVHLPETTGDEVTRDFRSQGKPETALDVNSSASSFYGQQLNTNKKSERHRRAEDE